MSKPRQIVHCFRAPVGGLFRHVCDLVAVQAQLGHEIGVICNSRSGGDAARERLEKLAGQCSLGLVRVPMSRQIGLYDLVVPRAVRTFARKAGADVLHGHGAKGGAYARLAAAKLKKHGQKLLACYTPHGGSLHYDPATRVGRLFLALERRLAPLTDCLIFESNYSAGFYKSKVGPYPCEAFVIPNGLWPEEFYDIVIDPDAADFLFVGELRHLKGVDVLLNALAELRHERTATAVIVGAGPDEARFRRMTKQLGLEASVTFAGPMPARRAFTRGACLLVPSRAKSFPYIVLEAAAVRLPMILSNVGGIPEIVSGTGIELVPPGDHHALKARMAAFLDDTGAFVGQARELQSLVSERYQATGMAQTVSDCYDRALMMKFRV